MFKQKPQTVIDHSSMSEMPYSNGSIRQLFQSRTTKSVHILLTFGLSFIKLNIADSIHHQTQVVPNMRLSIT